MQFRSQPLTRSHRQWCSTDSLDCQSFVRYRHRDHSHRRTSRWCFVFVQVYSGSCWTGCPRPWILCIPYVVVPFVSSSLICCCSACSTNVTVSLSFGGQSWPISPLDFNAAQISNGRNPLCLGAVFDISLGSNNIPDSSTPTWIFGDTFLVRNIS